MTQYIFAFRQLAGTRTVLITPKDYWNKEHCMGEFTKDQCKELAPILEEFNLVELMEGEFEIPLGFDKKLLHNELEKRGLRFNKHFQHKIRRQRG